MSLGSELRAVFGASGGKAALAATLPYNLVLRP